MDEFDLAAAREGKAMRRISDCAVKRPKHPRGVSRRDVSRAIKRDFVEELNDVQTRFRESAHILLPPIVG